MPSAPQYNLMDRDVQPPGYHVYREEKETFGDCIWHLSLAECCFWVFPCLDGLVGRSPLTCCLGSVNACCYCSCIMAAPPLPLPIFSWLLLRLLSLALGAPRRGWW